MIVSYAVFVGGIGAESIVDVEWYVVGWLGDVDVPQVGGGGTFSNNDGVVVIRDSG